MSSCAKNYLEIRETEDTKFNLVDLTFEQYILRACGKYRKLKLNVKLDNAVKINNKLSYKIYDENSVSTFCLIMDFPVEKLLF